jgi:hypothetical protein
MSDEWFTKTKDRNASIGEFLEILGYSDSRDVKLPINAFVRGFKKVYTGKSDVTLYSVSDQMVDNRVYTSKNNVSKYFKDMGIMTQIERAENLGKVLGVALSDIEFIVNPNIGIALNDHSCSGFMDNFEFIAERLQSLNVKVKPKFLRKRLEVIAKARAKTLNKTQMKLLAAIASLF